MLRLDRSTRDAIVEHAHRDHPDEACGIVAGPAGSDTAARFIPMLNAERSMTGYRFEADEWRRIWLELDDRDEEPVVIYHSHTATEAYPSRTDVARAREYATMLPDPHYVLVSTRDPEATEPDAVEFRSFRIVDGVVTEEPVEVVDGAAPRDPDSGPADPGQADPEQANPGRAEHGQADHEQAGPGQPHQGDRPHQADPVQSYKFGHTPTSVVYDCSAES